MWKFASATSSAFLALGLLLWACAPAATPTRVPADTSTRQVATPTAVPATRVPPTPTAAPQMAPQPSLPKPQAPLAAEEKPRYGGILTMVQRQDAPNFDTHQFTTIHTNHFLQASYSNLIQFDPANWEKLIPDVAERWEESPDSKVYTFHLRKGVKFHDGMPLTSADVKMSLERLAWPPKGILSHSQGVFSALERVEAPDAYTVKAYLKYPQGSFLNTLAGGHMVIYPKHVVEKKGDMRKDIVGSGPFKLKNYIRGAVFEQERFEDYFVPGRPYLDGIERFIIPDPSAVFAALRTGRILFAGIRQHSVTPREDEILKREIPGIAIQYRAVPNAWGLWMHNERKPWGDVRVRRAASMAIDRPLAVQVLQEGKAVVGSYMPPGPYALPPEELSQIPGYGKDKEKERAEAKKLLADAGFPKGFKSTILTRAYTEYIDNAIFTKDQLAKIGIEMEIDARETATYASLEVAGQYDTTTYSIPGVLGDPDEIFGVRLITSAGGNTAKYSNPKVDELYQRQSRTTDPAERRRLVLEMNRLATLDSPLALFFWREHQSIFWPQVKGFTQPASFFLGWKFQDVWLAK